MKNSPRISGRLPGQSVSIFKNPKQLLIGLGIHDTAARDNRPIIMMEFNRDQARELIGDLLNSFEDLYETQYERPPVSPDTAI